MNLHLNSLRKNILLYVAFMGLVCVVFGTLYFATEPDQYVPAPCTVVAAVGSQSVTRDHGTTSISVASIKKECE